MSTILFNIWKSNNQHYNILTLPIKPGCWAELLGQVKDATKTWLDNYAVLDDHPLVGSPLGPGRFVCLFVCMYLWVNVK